MLRFRIIFSLVVFGGAALYTWGLRQIAQRRGLPLAVEETCIIYFLAIQFFQTAFISVFYITEDLGLHTWD